MMRILAINTIGPFCELALWQDGETLGHIHEPMSRGQDANLPVLTQKLLAGAASSFAEIDRYAVITGPGSFTGVRVGVAYARGLSLAASRPCIGVTSLEAALPEGQQGSAIVILPAQRRAPDITFWTQRFRSGEAVRPPEELPMDELVNLLGAHPHMVFGETGELALGGQIDVRQATPSARRAAELAALKTEAPAPPDPTYARAPDAAPPRRQ